MPSLERFHYFDRNLQVLDLSNQSNVSGGIKGDAAFIQTSDGFFVGVDVSILFRITDPYRLINTLGPGDNYVINGILPKAEPILKQITRISNNKLFHKIIYLYLLLWCGLQLMQTAALMYLQQVMRVPAETSFWMLIPFQVSALIGLQYWSFYSNKYSRLKALFKGSYIWISSCLLILVFTCTNQSMI